MIVLIFLLLPIYLWKLAAPPHLKNLPKPGAKMRVLNWTKIPNLKIAGTLWEAKDIRTLEELNFTEIEDLFCVAGAKGKFKAGKGITSIS